MLKQLFIGTKTSGLDPDRNAIIEIGGIIRVEDEPSHQFTFYAQPFPDDTVEEAALKVNGYTYNDIAEFPLPKEAHAEFTQLLSKYVDKCDKRDKFFMYGWNVDFDDRFMRAFFRKCGDKYYSSYILWPSVNIASLVTLFLREKYFDISGFHLHTVCAYFGIEVDEVRRHTALYDALLTMEVYDRINQQGD